MHIPLQNIDIMWKQWWLILKYSRVSHWIASAREINFSLENLYLLWVENQGKVLHEIQAMEKFFFEGKYYFLIHCSHLELGVVFYS